MFPLDFENIYDSSFKVLLRQFHHLCDWGFDSTGSFYWNVLGCTFCVFACLDIFDWMLDIVSVLSASIWILFSVMEYIVLHLGS